MPDMPDDRERERDDVERGSPKEWHWIITQVEEGRQARQKYVPMVERIDERMDALHDAIDRQNKTTEKLDATLHELIKKIHPLITEREIVMKIVRFLGGIVVGVLMSGAAWAFVEWLKTL